MAIRATLIATGETIELDNGDLATLELVKSLLGNCPKGVIECREHDGNPDLAHRRDEHGEVHGAWLYVRRASPDLLVLCHNGHNDPELRSGRCTLHVGKSDQHRYEQDAWCELGTRVGAEMTAERSIRGEAGTVVARLDVYGKADDREFGIEVQLSTMNEKTAKSRDTKALKAGVPLMWTAKSAEVPWAHDNAVAHVSMNDLTRSAPLEQWRIASGLRTFELRPCREFETCPVTGTPRNCGQWHPLWMADVDLERRLRAADFIERYADGSIVRLDTRSKQGVVPVDADLARQWNEIYPPTLPGPRSAPSERDRGSRNACGYGRVDELPLPVPVQRPAMPEWPGSRQGWTGPRDTPQRASQLNDWRLGDRLMFTCPECREPSVEPIHPTCDATDPDWYLDQQVQRGAASCTGNRGLCGVCVGGPCTKAPGARDVHVPDPTNDDDPLLARPDVMRAAWWRYCGCGALVHGPGSTGLPCPCGARHARGDVVGLAAVDGAKRWVCRGCVTAADVPAPRSAAELAEVAR